MQNASPKPRPLFSCLLRAIFLLIGVPLILGALLVGITVSSGDLLGNSLAVGRLTGIHETSVGCPYYVVTFTPTGGRDVTFDVQLCDGQQVGDPVQVMYDARNPELLPMLVDFDPSGSGRLLGAGLVGLLLTLLGALPIRGKSRPAPSPAPA